MLVAHGVDPGDQLEVVPAPGGRQATAEGASVHLGRHRHGHHAGRVGSAQAEVVHDVVGVVVVDLRLDLLQHIADVRFDEAQAQALALELRAVHAAPGVTCLAVALAGGEFDQGVLVGGPADRDVAVPLLPARRHGIPGAVLVIVGLRVVAGEAQVAEPVAGGGVQHLVEAAIGAGQQAGVDPRAEFAEALRLTLEEDRPGRRARPPEHRLRALDHGELVVGFRRDVGGRRVHPVRTGTEHHAAVGEDVQARTEHPAQHRVAVAAAVADHREAGNGLQVVGPIAGRYRLARLLGIGDDGQRRTLGDSGDHARRQLHGVILVLGVLLGQERRRRQGQAAQCGEGSRPAAALCETGRVEAESGGRAGVAGRSLLSRHTFFHDLCDFRPAPTASRHPARLASPARRRRAGAPRKRRLSD